MIHRALPVWALSFFLCAFLQAQSLPTAVPEEVGMSSQRMGNIDQLLQDHIDREKISGAVALVARNGQVAYQRAIGMADRGATLNMEPNTLFRIISMTKPVTTVAAMILYEEGRFGLDDPLYWYIPAFKDMKVLQDGELEPAKSPITIRHLLTHTSGISYSFTGRDEIAQSYKSMGITDGFFSIEGTLADFVEKVAKAPLANHPGEKWEYGLNTDVLGRLVEIWSGQLLDEFLRERIFKPLGMQDTYFYLGAEEAPRLAALYRPQRDGGTEKTPGDLQKVGNMQYSATMHYLGPQSFFSGGAGLVSTAPDYARFLQMLLNGGKLDGVRILGPKTIELMTSNQTGAMYTWEKGTGYGFGVAVETGPEHTGLLGSPGVYRWLGVYNTHFWVDPQENMFAILLTQIYPNQGLNLDQKFRAAVYQALVE